MLGREAHIGEHVRLGAVHQNGELGQLRPELIGNGAPLPGGIRRIIPAATALLRARSRDDGDSRATPRPGSTSCQADDCLWVQVPSGQSLSRQAGTESCGRRGNAGSEV
jgi:hypothetical protein